MRQLLFLILIFNLPFAARTQGTIHQKSIGLTVSFPWINNYTYYDYEWQKSTSKTGFVGIGASAYYKTGKSKYSLNYGFTGSLPVPFGPVDYEKEGTRSNIISNFFEGLYHKKLAGNLNFVAGANYVNYRYDFTSYVDTLPSYKVNDRTMGLTIGSEYRFGKTFSIALFYRPSLFYFDQKNYRHLISIDARFDINIFKID